MSKSFHGLLFSGTDLRGQFLFGCRAIGPKFQAYRLEPVQSGRSVKTTTPKLKVLACAKNYVQLPFKLDCVSKSVTSWPRKQFGAAYSQNVLLSRNMSLQSQVRAAVLHPRSKRPILKYIHHLDELLSALAPYARSIEPCDGSFRGIEACMAMNHLHRLRFQCQVLVDANCRVK